MPANLFSSQTDEPTTLEGTLQHVVYTSPESGWTVARLEVQPEGEPVTVVGNLSGVRPGESLHLNGRWVDDRRWGRQFRIESFLCIQPSTLVGIEKYLGSGLVRGIGPVMAHKLVEHFGLETLHVIDAEPARLHEVAGLGRVRISALRAAWQEQRGIREVMVFLQSHGVSAAHAARIYKKYGPRAVGIVTRDPYRLARDVAGIGFLSADHIASTLGVERDSPLRIQAGVLHLLDQAAEDGHCYLPRARLVEAAAALLEVEPEAADQAIAALARAQQAVVEEEVEAVPVYAAPLHEVESSAALALARLVRAPARRRQFDLERELNWFESTSGLRLADAQRHAVARALQAKVLVVTGGPGTGKTTLVLGVLRILERHGLHAALCAPTGRAAKRLAEATDHEAKTIHRLLEFNPRDLQFRRNAHLPVDADVIIVDEVSMVDVTLLHHLLKAVRPQARLLLVGDADQLPSVGPGAVLADIIASKAVETVRLNQIFRQDEASLIVANAHRIRDGEAPRLPPPGERADFVLVEREAPAEVLATLRVLVAERLPARLGVDPRTDVQVLVPMHRGPLGAAALNAELQDLLNPDGAPVGGTGLRIGDKVMQTRNNYDLEVYNGDLGLLEAVSEADRVAWLRFEDRSVKYDLNDLSELTLAYACTVHKSQGSEYPLVIVVLHSQHHIMLQRNLLYTAVTRARRQVILLGQRRALQTALRNARRQSRYTRLAERLRAAAPPA